jgi:hypothetical protein
LLVEEMQPRAPAMGGSQGQVGASATGDSQGRARVGSRVPRHFRVIC